MQRVRTERFKADTCVIFHQLFKNAQDTEPLLGLMRSKGLGPHKCQIYVGLLVRTRIGSPGAIRTLASTYTGCTGRCSAGRTTQCGELQEINGI